MLRVRSKGVVHQHFANKTIDIGRVDAVTPEVLQARKTVADNAHFEHSSFKVASADFHLLLL